MIGFFIGCFFGTGLTLILIGCFALEKIEVAYAAGYSNGYIAGADVTAEKDIAKGVCM